jgi:hypothetical protein
MFGDPGGGANFRTFFVKDLLKINGFIAKLLLSLFLKK